MTPDFIPSDPTILALEDDITDVFAIHDVRAQAGGRGVMFTGEFLRSPAMVYDVVAERFAARGRIPVLRQEGGRDILIAQVAPPARGRRRVRVNVILFALTVLSVLYAGVMMNLTVPVAEAYQAALMRLAVAPDAALSARLACTMASKGVTGALFAAQWRQGLSFTLALLGILGVHEFGHYFTARRYKLDTSLPYFIPFPNQFTGTMGAVIRIDSPFTSRKALFDVGIAGPLAGLVVAIPVLIAGLSHATFLPLVSPETSGVVFNEPLLFRGLAWLVIGARPAGMDIEMNPLIMASWWGLLVTAINLLPVSQLDGGHINYAVFGRFHRYVAWGMYGLAVAVEVGLRSYGYLIMLVLILFMGLQHPPALDDITDVGRFRRVLGIGTLLLFFVLVTPVPLEFMGGVAGRSLCGLPF